MANNGVITAYRLAIAAHNQLSVTTSIPRHSATTFVMSVNATEALPESPIPAQANAQKIDPWNVQGEIDENGKVLAINYKKL